LTCEIFVKIKVFLLEPFFGLLVLLEGRVELGVMLAAGFLVCIPGAAVQDFARLGVFDIVARRDTVPVGIVVRAT
jgi:hypothetical protein